MSQASTPRHSVSVAGAVIRDGRILAVQRRDNAQWEPPGGVLELDESISDGLRREIREETGLDVEPVRLTGVYKNMTRAIVALVFECTVVGGALHTSDETKALAWLTPDEIRERMSEAFAVRVIDALDSGSVPVRTHDGVSLNTP